MKKFFAVFFWCICTLFSAQNVLLTKVVKTNANNDKFLYKVDPAKSSAEYLGEVEVQGFSDDDANVFGRIYKKAKQIGANAFSLRPIEQIDGNASFDPVHYRLSLYYVDPMELNVQNNIIYIIGSAHKNQNLAINGTKINFPPRTFTIVEMQPGEVYTISTRKILGSSIKVGWKEKQPVQYFQISGFAVNNNQNGVPGIHFKSGDIIKLEQSYAQFLTTIYKQF